VFHNEMRFTVPQEHDTVLAYVPPSPGAEHYAVVAVPDGEGSLRLPVRAEYSQEAAFVYAFSIDDQRFFLLRREKSAAGVRVDDPPGYEAIPIGALRTFGADAQAFAAITGFHLHVWYSNNVRCGRCGKVLAYSHTERALECRSCGQTVYPRISPAVIVAVTDGDKLLLTRYAHGSYRARALVAGFVEVGETAEQAVAREVFEECGVHVKDIRYYGSQPWGMSGTLMLGYVAALDGSPKITLQEDELSEAEWVHRDCIEDGDDYALGREMILRFKNRQWPW
jgi:NAD+ diphosphatase